LILKQTASCVKTPRLTGFPSAQASPQTVVRRLAETVNAKRTLRVLSQGANRSEW
jgi:hypothetical protein